MHLKHLTQPLRALTLALLAGGPTLAATAQVNYYECSDKGYYNATFNTKAGIVATTNKGSEIFLVGEDSSVRPLVASPGAGMYVNVSKDGRYIGYKSINGNGDQAPAILDVTTGVTTLLENYSYQCGQVSFADDGTMAYTVGNSLIVRKGGESRSFDLGTYVNIVNISPDGTRAAYATIDGDMYILDLTAGTRLSLGANDGYRPVWSPDGSKLAVSTVRGRLLSYSLSDNRSYDLGEATSASWAGDSQLVITRSVRENELTVKGAEVLTMDYTGANASVLVDLTEEVPVSATLEGRELTVSYANGTARGITRTTFSGSVRKGAPAKVRRIVAVENSDARVGSYVANNFGGYERPSAESLGAEGFARYVAELEAEAAQPYKAPAKANDIGLTAIPYINQVWDTPAVGGSTAYGYVCCAPSSSCMMLGYYGKLTPHAVTSRSSAAAVKTCNYSWYVAMQYTSVSGYTFSTSASGGGYWGYTYGVKGGYGYMWGLGSPASMMANFHKNNGVNNSWFESSWSVLTRECGANRPYVICLANGTGGHVVLVFRANQIAYNDGSGAYAKTGSFVCHDPYGDYNGSSYPNWDGRYSSYDWPGYNNGRANIGTFYWGCVTQSSGTPVTTNPTISVDKEKIHFTCQLNETPTIQFNVTGKDLSGDIAVASSHGWRFEVSPSTLPKTGGTVTVRMAHSEKAGTYEMGGTALDGSFYVKLKSGTTEKMVGITAEVTAPPLSGVTEKYNFSVNNGNADANGYDLSKIRNFVYHNGKLYCVYNNQEILVLAAQTGKKLGVLSNGTIVGPGTLPLADVKVIDGVIVASNIATAAKDESLRLYAWESDEAAPYLLFDTKDFQGAPRVGDCLEMSGNFRSDCWFAFGNDDNTDTRIIEYNRKDGVWTAKNTKVLKDGKHYALGSTMRAYPKGSGWWVNGKNGFPAWTNNPGGGTCEVQCQNNTGQTRGSDHHEFYWLGLKYAINTVYDDVNGSNGRMRIIHDKAGDFSSTSEIGKWPAAGLGKAGSNPNGTGDCMVNTDGQTYLEAWVLITGQGLAYYTVNTPPAQDPQPFTPAATEKTPVISVAKSSVSLSAKPGETADDVIAVTVSDLRENVMARLGGANADAFTISPDNLSADGNITVTYHPAAAGTHQADITLTSKDAQSVVISVVGTCKDDTPVDPTPLTPEVGEFGEIWHYSIARNNLPSWFDQSSQYTRTAAIVGDKVVVANIKAWASSGLTVTAVSADAGAATSPVNTTGISGGLLQIGSLVNFNGRLVASNAASAASTFRVYMWKNGLDQAPELILEDADHGKVPAGENMYISNGRIGIAGNDGTNFKVIWYQINPDGSADATPHVIVPVTKAIGNRGGTSVYFESDGSFWLNNKDMNPTHFSADGQTVLHTVGTDDKIAGTGMTMFSYGRHRYMLCSHSFGGSTPYGNKSARVIDITDPSQPVARETYPATGFGDSSWSAVGSTDVKADVVEYKPGYERVRFVALGPTQGIALYQFEGRSTGVQAIVADNDPDAPVEFYNLQGVRMDSDNLAPGIYIRRQGNKATKVLVR